jgi:colanic acid biosynthesis glycosyl transferase WcaI
MANVLLYSLLFPPDGNSNAYIFADIALELQKYGHAVTVITTTPHYSIVEENLERQPFADGGEKWYKRSCFHGIDCYHIVVPPQKGNMKQRIKTYIAFHKRALELSSKIDADIVIAQSPPLSTGVIGYLIAKKKKAKSVYVVQDLFPDGPITQGRIKNKIIIKALRSIEKSVYKRNNAVIAISEGIRGHLEDRVPKETILRMIPNFANTDIYHPMKKDNHLAERFGVKGKFVVSYVGNIGNAHDLSPVLYCADVLKELDIEFIIAGNGIKEDYYKRKVNEAGLKNVKFIGYQKREDTPFINAFSDICLVVLAPHVKDFSFPSKIYTIMAMAKPIIIICSGENNATRFIAGSKAGWFVDSSRCEEFVLLVKELYNNREKLNQYGRNSLEIIESGFTKEYVGRRYNELINELCGKAGKDGEKN